MISTLGVPKDEPIQNKMISNALERAQQKIEGFNFDSRKQVLAYDDVLSQHRETIYARRRTLLFNEHDALGDLFEEIQEKQTELAGDMRANREKFDDKELFWNTFRHIALTTTDKLWMEHLQVMDHTRQSVNLRAYGQRQPIVEYKKEGLRLFREMENAFYHQVATILARMDVSAIQKAQQIGEKTQAVTSEATDVEPEDLKPNDKVVITKDGEEKIVKVKKLPDYETAGWTIRQ
jgi:preprotein translocase subunit SecA